MKNRSTLIAFISGLLILLSTANIIGQGNAMDFDGVNDAVLVTNPSNFPSGNDAYTWEVWFYNNGNPGTCKILSWGGFGSPGIGVYVGLAGGTTLEVDHWGGGYDFTYPFIVPTNTWMHLAGTYDGNGTETVYANGVQVGQRTNVPTLNVGTNEFRVGDLYQSLFNEEIDGIIDEVRIYNVARSQEEIVSSMNCSCSEAGVDLPNLVLCYTFDDNADPVTDLVGTNHGTILPNTANGPQYIASVANITECNPIPTMGEWALVIFGLLILTLGAVSTYNVVALRKA